MNGDRWSLVQTEPDGFLVYELVLNGVSMELVSWSDQAFVSIHTPAAEPAGGNELADFPLHRPEHMHDLVEVLIRLGADPAGAEELAVTLMADIVHRRSEVQLPPLFPRVRRLLNRIRN